MREGICVHQLVGEEMEHFLKRNGALSTEEELTELHIKTLNIGNLYFVRKFCCI